LTWPGRFDRTEAAGKRRDWRVKGLGGFEERTHELWQLWQFYRFRAAIERVGGDVDAADIVRAIEALLEGGKARRRTRDPARRNGDELPLLLRS
jgi:hypothetical protein